MGVIPWRFESSPEHLWHFPNVFGKVPFSLVKRTSPAISLTKPDFRCGHLGLVVRHCVQCMSAICRRPRMRSRLPWPSGSAGERPRSCFPSTRRPHGSGTSRPVRSHELPRGEDCIEISLLDVNVLGSVCPGCNQAAVRRVYCSTGLADVGLATGQRSQRWRMRRPSGRR